MYVIEGDQQTLLDADRIEKAGAPAIQINTGSGCHLDAQMVESALKNWMLIQIQFFLLKMSATWSVLLCSTLGNIKELWL